MTAPCPSFGFIVTLEFQPGARDLDRTRFWSAWTRLLEEHGLYCTGGGGDSTEYVIASEAAQATDLDRRAVQAWLGARPELSMWRVGELIDLGETV
jgi:uncharacterized protein YggL (DUF469 family)